MVANVRTSLNHWSSNHATVNVHELTDFLRLPQVARCQSSIETPARSSVVIQPGLASCHLQRLLLCTRPVTDSLAPGFFDVSGPGFHGL